MIVSAKENDAIRPCQALFQQRHADLLWLDVETGES
jgi:hypothetical protein